MIWVTMNFMSRVQKVHVEPSQDWVNQRNIWLIHQMSDSTKQLKEKLRGISLHASTSFSQFYSFFCNFHKFSLPDKKVPADPDSSSRISARQKIMTKEQMTNRSIWQQQILPKKWFKARQVSFIDSLGKLRHSIKSPFRHTFQIPSSFFLKSSKQWT